jgi:pimeloyl-ACP methyl ester carboxylesterase
VIAGHSRGGALAARFVAERAQPAGTPLDGLILIGTTHPRDHDLSTVPFPVLRIVASEDCVAPPSAARANAGSLPPETTWVEIAGGNHRQFGYYGWQIGDCAATISREEQHRQVIEAVTGFLRLQPQTAELVLVPGHQ